MTLYDFKEMAIDTCYECYVWDNDKLENVFEGTLDDLTDDELLECEVTSWELDNGKIGFNIN